jgi:hypothetical protein
MRAYVSPFDDRVRDPVPFAVRLASMSDQVIGLLDISKPKGREFLDRVEELLISDHGVGRVRRLVKPTFTRPAPPDVLSEAERCGAILVALAD